jgi:hypothetical protein
MKAKTAVLGYSLTNLVLFILDTSLLLGDKPSYLEAGSVFSALSCLGIFVYVALDNYDKRISELEKVNSINYEKK